VKARGQVQGVVEVLGHFGHSVDVLGEGGVAGGEVEGLEVAQVLQERGADRGRVRDVDVVLVEGEFHSWAITGAVVFCYVGVQLCGGRRYKSSPQKFCFTFLWNVSDLLQTVAERFEPQQLSRFQPTVQVLSFGLADGLHQHFRDEKPLPEHTKPSRPRDHARVLFLDYLARSAAGWTRSFHGKLPNI
jgi:hypothetical protein